SWPQVVSRVAKSLAAIAGQGGSVLAETPARNSDNVINASPNRDSPMATPETAAETAAPQLEITTSRQMLSWLAEQKLSIAFTTYQIGKLFLLGLKASGELSVFERSFNRCM